MGIGASTSIREHDLSELLAVSRATLFVWRKRGLPVLSRGGPGVSAAYDLLEVDAWLRHTGLGVRANGEHGARLGALRDEIERRALAGGVQTSAQNSPANSGPPAVAVLPDRRVIGEFLGKMFEDSAPGWGAFVVARYELDAAVVLELLQDLLFFLVTDAGERLGMDDPGEFEFLMPGWIDGLKDPQERAAILARVNTLADAIRSELATDASTGDVSGDG